MGHLLTTRVPAMAPGLTSDADPAPDDGVSCRADRSDACARSSSAIASSTGWCSTRGGCSSEVSGRFDLYHVVDHSYAQLALALPANRTIVSCHDIDTFRSLVEPDQRSARAAVQRDDASGSSPACGGRRSSCAAASAAHDDLVRFRLVDPARLRIVPNGIDPALLRAAIRTRRAPAPPSCCRRSEACSTCCTSATTSRASGSTGWSTSWSRCRRRGHWVRLVRVGSLREADAPAHGGTGAVRFRRAAVPRSRRPARAFTNAAICCCSHPTAKAMGCRCWRRSRPASRWSPATSPRCASRLEASRRWCQPSRSRSGWRRSRTC